MKAVENTGPFHIDKHHWFYRVNNRIDLVTEVFSGGFYVATAITPLSETTLTKMLKELTQPKRGK